MSPFLHSEHMPQSFPSLLPKLIFDVVDFCPPGDLRIYKNSVPIEFERFFLINVFCGGTAEDRFGIWATFWVLAQTLHKSNFCLDLHNLDPGNLCGFICLRFCSWRFFLTWRGRRSNGKPTISCHLWHVDRMHWRNFFPLTVVQATATTLGINNHERMINTNTNNITIHQQRNSAQRSTIIFELLQPMRAALLFLARFEERMYALGPGPSVL